MSSSGRFLGSNFPANSTTQRSGGMSSARRHVAASCSSPAAGAAKRPTSIECGHGWIRSALDAERLVVPAIGFTDDEERRRPGENASQQRLLGEPAHRRAGAIEQMRIAAKQNRHAARVKGTQCEGVRKPPPSGDVHGVGMPGAHLRDERWIVQAEEMMRPGIARPVGNALESVALRERNVPRDRPRKAVVLDRLASVMPGEEHLDLDVVAACQALMQRRIILNRMRHDEREPHLACRARQGRHQTNAATAAATRRR